MKRMILLLVLMAACTPKAIEFQEEGRAVFAITDDANVSVDRVYIDVEEITVHSNTEGWLTIYNDSMTFDLLELKDENITALIADTYLLEGNYNQVRLEVGNVIVEDKEGRHNATLPSSIIRANIDMVVSANSTSITTFDFLLDDSLHSTGNGKYMLSPVVKVSSKDRAEVTIMENKVIERGGNLKTEVEVTSEV